MRPRIEELARRIIDGVEPRGECDLVTDIAGLMPSYVIADMLGIPLEDGVELYGLTEKIHAAPESQEAGAAMMAVMEMFNYAREVWERKRAEPADDLATLIATATVDDRELDVIDFNLFFLLLIDAGGDTTRNLVAGGMDALFAHPEQLAWLRDDLDARLACAIEELLRWISPVVYMRRTAERDTELDGVPDRRGAEGRHVLRVGQPRPRGFRTDRRDARPRAYTERACRVRGRRSALLSRCAHRPHRDPCAAQRATHALRRRPTDGGNRVVAVDIHLRPEAPPDRVLSRRPQAKVAELDDSRDSCHAPLATNRRRNKTLSG